jgi:phosphoglucosamine mutase
MREGGFNVGGEQSGHIIFSDFITTGDGLIAALQVLAVLAEERRPASEAVHMFEPAPQVLENVRFANGSPLSNPKVTSAIKLFEQKLDGGRLLVRKSGTEPVIRIMAEHENEKLVRDVVKEVAQLIRDNAA